MNDEKKYMMLRMYLSLTCLIWVQYPDIRTRRFKSELYSYHRKNLLSASILITRGREQVGLSKDYRLFSSLSDILKTAGISDLWTAYPTRNWIM